MAGEFTEMQRRLAALEEQVTALEMPTPPSDQFGVDNQAIGEMHLNVGDGSAGDLLSSDGSGQLQWVPNNYVLVRDVKSANTAGGDFLYGAWRVRVINEETVDTGGLASLPGSNIIRLAAGTWRCYISAPGFQVNRHKIRLWDTTAGAVIAYGSSEYSTSAAAHAQTRSVLSARFTLGAQSDLRVEHRCQTTRTVYGLGINSDFGVEEVYTIAEFWKVG